MKKQVKIITTILIILTILCSLANIVFGAGIINSLSGDKTDKITASGSMTDLGGKIIGAIQIIGIIIAIVVLLVLGIKYMVGSAEEKAEYKKTMMPYVVGALLIFAASTIVNLLYSVINSAANPSGSK